MKKQYCCLSVAIIRPVFSYLPLDFKEAGTKNIDPSIVSLGPMCIKMI